MKSKAFFVYGTLKIGGVFAKHFDEHRLSSEKATLKGMDLYEVGWFPGILPGKGPVIGELHNYKNPDTVLKHMDQIEGYNDNENDLFKRECKTVITASGKEVEAIVYVYNNNVPSSLEIIENGIWDLNKKGEE